MTIIPLSAEVPITEAEATAEAAEFSIQTPSHSSHSNTATPKPPAPAFVAETDTRPPSREILLEASRSPAQNNSTRHSLSPTRAPNGSGFCTPDRLRAPLTQEYRPAATPTIRSYEPDASIALIGIRGTGLSSLAIMGSSALGFNLVDADQHFYQATGLSRGAYKSAHGVTNYRLEELRQLRHILSENQKRAVIACGPGAVEATGQSLLGEFAKTHPVVYIMRDTEGIQKHLSVWDTDTISRLLRLSAPIHRSLSSFEFYNLDEPTVLQQPDQLSFQPLALKQVEQDFVRLIHGITDQGENDAKNDRQYGLASLPLEARPFSYVMSLPISALEKIDSRFRNGGTSADAVELIIPFEEIHKGGTSFNNSIASYVSRQYYTAVRNIGVPIIFHVEIGHLASWAGSHRDAALMQQVYFDVLHHGLRLAPEYLTVDLSSDEQMIRQLINSKGSTKVIGHCFKSNPGPAQWLSPERRDQVTRAQDIGCDMVRICQPAITLEDNFALQSFILRLKESDRLRIPLIAYNTGPLGRLSNVLNPILTPISHPLLRTLIPEHPSTSQLTISEAQNALYCSFVLSPMKFGIYGENVNQSLSPAMHNAAFKACGMPHDYQFYQYPNLTNLKQLIRDHDFGGISITAPFKRDVIPLVDRMSREAQAIGAVNTILPLRTTNANPLLESNLQGPVVALYGENTDWIGIYACIHRNLSPINAVQGRTTALILGAGGMARAAAYALVRLGVQTIFVHNRTLQNAEALAKQFHGRAFMEPRPGDQASGSCASTANGDHGLSNSLTVRVLGSKDEPWPEDSDYPTIVVSAVPNGRPGTLVVDNTLPLGWLASPSGGVVIELEYRPLTSPLLKQVRDLSNHGWIGVDGMQVLPEQGTVQFEFFTSKKAPKKIMKDAILQAYKERAGRMDTPSDSVPSD